MEEEFYNQDLGQDDYVNLCKMTDVLNECHLQRYEYRDTYKTKESHYNSIKKLDFGTKTIKQHILLFKNAIQNKTNGNEYYNIKFGAFFQLISAFGKTFNSKIFL